MLTSVKALIPAAGYGRRLAEFTAGRPKELLKIGSLTMIEHAAAMILDSGLDQLGVVVRPDKREPALVLEGFLKAQGPKAARLSVIYQDPPQGVGHAMLAAAEFAGDSPLAVIMPDNLVLGGPPALKSMLDVFFQVRTNTMGAVMLPASRAAEFGNVGRLELEESTPGAPVRVRFLSPKSAGSLAAPSAEVFPKGSTGVVYEPGWADRLGQQTPNFQGEIDDTDLVIDLIAAGRMYAALLQGTPFDLGHPLGLAAARAWLAEHEGYEN